MAKTLSDVLKGSNRSTRRPGRTGERPGVDYASKMQDERDFVAAHDTEEFEDRVGNGSDVYNATNIKQSSDERHGHTPQPKDEKKYKENNEETLAPSASTRPTQKPSSNNAPSSSTRPQTRPTRIGSVRGQTTALGSEGSTRGAGLNYNEENQQSEEKEMMKRQLHFIKYAAEEIMAYIDSSEDPEEWFQNKLSGLHSEIKGLHAYIEGDKRLKGSSNTPKMPNMNNEGAEGDPRVEPKDTKGKGKSLRMITGQVKESNNGSPKKTAAEQARDRFDKKKEREEMRQETQDDN